LGGTQMLGRHFVSSIIHNDTYDMQLANRGKTDPDFCKDRTISIDRDSLDRCSVLASRLFDVVVDFSCYTIRHLVNILDHIGYNQYILISTQSVLDKYTLNSTTESAYKTYCQNKYDIEKFVLNHQHPNIHQHFFVLRPCAVYGDNDYTQRFIKRGNKFYWRHSGTEAHSDPNCVSIDLVTQTIINTIDTTQQHETNSISIINISNNQPHVSAK